MNRHSDTKATIHSRRRFVKGLKCTWKLMLIAFGALTSGVFGFIAVGILSSGLSSFDPRYLEAEIAYVFLTLTVLGIWLCISATRELVAILLS